MLFLVRRMGASYPIGVRPGVALDLSMRWLTDAAFNTRDSVLHAGLRLSVLALGTTIHRKSSSTQNPSSSPAWDCDSNGPIWTR